MPANVSSLCTQQQRSHSTVMAIGVECCIDPVTDVAVTVTVSFFGGGGGALLPPQPANTIKRAITVLPRNQSLIPRLLLQRDLNPIAPSKNPGTGKATAIARSRPPSVSGGANATRLVGAVIVSVDVPEFAPKLTDEGDTAQVASGAGPLTVQLRLTCPEKPFFPVSASASVTCAPVCIVKLADAGAMVKSGGGRTLNVAVTDSAATTVTLQSPDPVHAPLHPAN